MHLPAIICDKRIIVNKPSISCVWACCRLHQNFHIQGNNLTVFQTEQNSEESDRIREVYNGKQPDCPWK